MQSTPAIIAHRGASHCAPENTAAAFDAALAEGADGIELDLQLSRDGVVVVFHDKTLARLGGHSQRVHDFDWQELAQIDAGRGPHGRRTGHCLLRLEQVLERWAPHTHLYLEIKHAEGRRRRKRHRQLGEAVARLVGECSWQSNCALLSFHDAAIDTVATALPQLPCIRNVRWAPGLKSVRRKVGRLAGVSIDIRRFSPHYASALAALDRPLYAYTCDNDAALQRALALHINHVITNHPQRSRTRLQALLNPENA